MRKRVAAKVVRRSYWLTAAEMPYKDGTLTRAVEVFLRAADREFERRNWIPIAIVVRPQEGAVRPARGP
jgi:hypothetical protein